MRRTPAIPTMTLEDMIATRRMHDQQPIPMALFYAILANMRRAHNLMIQDANAVLELGPQIAAQLSDWANEMREHRFTPAETACNVCKGVCSLLRVRMRNALNQVILLVVRCACGQVRRCLANTNSRNIRSPSQVTTY